MSLQLQEVAAADEGPNDNGDLLVQPRRVLPKSFVQNYIGFLTILIGVIAGMSSSAFSTHPIRMIVFVVSLSIWFVGIQLKPFLQIQARCINGLYNGTTVFTSILNPFALLSLFLPHWLSLLGLVLIFIITVVAVAPDFVWFIGYRLYEKLTIQAVCMREMLSAWTMMGQITEQELSAA